MQDLEFEWDERKSNQVFEERCFDFGFAAEAFLDPQAVHPPGSRSYVGEDRFRLYGQARGRLLIVVYTRREGRIRIITAWKANSRDVQTHARWILAEGNIKPGLDPL
ncbi:BrnT family toxin [Synechococcus sp. CBW1107]|uniref:BrnT family toxin n=1 Tax=Synechococcus sp. CBW1107 TaxID=2789857 RepID=UPI003A102979